VASWGADYNNAVEHSLFAHINFFVPQQVTIQSCK